MNYCFLYDHVSTRKQLTYRTIYVTQKGYVSCVMGEIANYVQLSSHCIRIML